METTRPGDCSRYGVLIDAPFNEITHEVIGAAIEVHKILGPGLMESSYLPCLCAELEDRKLRYDSERTIPVIYKGRALKATYRLDIIVEDIVVVELKSVERFLAVHEAQVLTYMRLLQCPAGLLINFNVNKLIHGIRRLLLPAPSRLRKATE